MSMEATAGTYSFTVVSNATAASVSGIWNKITTPAAKDTSFSINGETINITKDEPREQIEKDIIETCQKMNLSYSTSGRITSNAAGDDYYVEIKYEDGTKQKNVGTNAEVTLGQAAAGQTGFTDSARYTAKGNLLNIIDEEGVEMTVELPSGDKALPNNKTVRMKVYDAGYMTIQIGANEHQTLDMDFPTVSCDALKLRDQNGKDLLNVCTNYGASNGIALADTAIRQISTARAKLGAYQNRLETTVSSLNVFGENMTESMSRIIDTDMASEMTEYTQLTVLQQAATSMLSQANNRPQTIMSLLQGM